jgi:hypothetical protein
MKNLILISLLFTFPDLKAQTYDVDTLLYNGDVNKLINIVILGDGYTAAETAQFISNAETMSDYLFTVSPFLEYKNYFNVLVVHL